MFGGPDTPEAVYAADLPYTPGRGRQDSALSLLAGPALTGQPDTSDEVNAGKSVVD